jgi:serpin B
MTRRRYYAIAVFVVVAALVAVLLPRLIGGSDHPPRRHPSDVAVGPGLHVAGQIGSARQLVATKVAAGVGGDPSDVQHAATADTSLAIDLLQRLQSTSSNNLSVSPMSLALALTMVQNGARGKTLAGILTALHAGGLAGDRLDAGWARLVREWTAAAASSGFALESANSLWLQHGLPTRAAFMAALARYFNTGVWQVDFSAPSAVDAINKWTSQQTHGRITKLFDQLDPDTMAVLANAVYFKAAWDQPFDPHDTHPGLFTLADGSTAQVPFMSQMAGLLAAKTAGYDAVQLPYRGGRFAALAIMPTAGSLTDYVRGLDGAALTTVVSGLHSSQVDLALPKFTTTSTLALNDALKAMGMGDAFSPSADFSALSPVSTQISQVVQRVYLKVAEKGTEAAAVTGVDMVGSSARAAAPTEIRLDHPFLFLIRDTTTGAILFASEIQHPAS